MKAARKNNVLEFFTSGRTVIQLVLGIGVYILVSYLGISLWWLLAFGTLTGLIWGKVFCRWMCPVGILMEFFMKHSGDSFRNMYQYHKLGCPIAWISGLLNRFSLYRISLNADTCKDCGLCDKACYLPAVDQQKFSLYLQGKENPGDHFSCSKCLSCVTSCPNGSLSYKPGLSFLKIKP